MRLIVRRTRALAVLLAIVLLSSLMTATAYAQNEPTVRLSGYYDSVKNTLKVTASLSGADRRISTGMLTVEYDKSLLTQTDAPKTVGDAKLLRTNQDSKKGYTGLEWRFDKGLSSAGYTDFAVMSFSVKSGANLTDIAKVISICTDRVYLDSVNGYGYDGGVLLCGGSASYSASEKNVRVEYYTEGLLKHRMGGTDRFDTAVKIAAQGWQNGAASAVICSSQSFADALAGVPMAYAIDAPILLVSGTKVNSKVSAQLKSMGCKNVYILGGTSAVSSSIASSLKNSGYSVERVYGQNRFETAVAIAKKTRQLSGNKPTSAIFAYGYNYPDALAVSSAAAITGTPILYAPNSGKLDKATSAYIKDNGIGSAVILGGTSAVGSSVEKNITAAGVSVTRVSGKDRYATALAICRKYDPMYVSSDISIATADAFPDALAGGAFAAKKGIPVILVGKGMKAADIKEYTSGKSYKNIYIFGGTSAVPESYINKIL